MDAVPLIPAWNAIASFVAARTVIDQRSHTPDFLVSYRSQEKP